MLKTNRESIKSMILKYSLLFVVTALGCYFFFMLSGKTLIKYSSGNADGLTQTYTAYIALKRMIADFLSGQGISSWDWSLGLGGDTFETFGFKLFNPLTYFIIAFPDDLIDVGYSIANILREYLAGLTFLLCMREVNLNSKQCIIGAMSYTFSGWLLVVAFNQGSFENAAIIFPLLIMGTEKFFKKKSPVLFIISVALCMATGVTWAYVCGILTIAYYLARYHDYHRQESISVFAKTTGKYVIYGVTGILISAPFLFSILCSMDGTTISTDADYRVWTFALNKYLAIPEGLFKYTEVGATSYSYICMSVICVTLLPMIVVSMKKRSTVAWIAGILSVLSLIPLTSRIFNGFSYPAGRWYFALVFFLIWATMEMLTEDTFKHRRNIIIMGTWLCVLVVVNVGLWIIGVEDSGSMLISLAGAFLGLTFIALAYLHTTPCKFEKYIPTAITVILILSLVMPSAGKTFSGTSDYLKQFLKVGESYAKLQSTPERVVSSIKDNSFFRSDQAYRINPEMKTKLKTNANMAYGNNSVYAYSSLIDAKWHLFNKAVGNNAGYYSRTNIISNDNRAPIDYLMGVKYFLGNNAVETNASSYAGYGYEYLQNIDGVDILKTDHCIGLGTAFDTYITESELLEYPQLVRDQVMLQTLVVSDDEAANTTIPHAKNQDIETFIDSVDCKLTALKNTVIDENNKTIEVSNGQGTIGIEIPTVQNAQLVVCLDGLARETNSYEQAIEMGAVKEPNNALARLVEATSYRDRGEFKIVARFNGITKYYYCEQDSPRGFNDVSEFNINLGYGDSIGGTVTIKLNKKGVYHFDNISVYAIPMTVLDENAAKLEHTSFKIEQFSKSKGDHITGNVTANKDSVLFLSIPYDKGWTAYVDDKKTEVIKNVDIAFSGVVIPEGKHKVTLEYHHVGMKAAILGTVIGIVSLIIIVFYRRKKNV